MYPLKGIPGDYQPAPPNPRELAIQRIHSLGMHASRGPMMGSIFTKKVAHTLMLNLGPKEQDQDVRTAISEAIELLVLQNVEAARTLLKSVLVQKIDPADEEHLNRALATHVFIDPKLRPLSSDESSPALETD